MRVVGIDGWGKAHEDGASDWVAVVLLDGAFERAVVAPSLAALLARVGAVDAVGIDIPIGLPDRAPRQADLLARARLGPRRSSVFLTPPRQALLAPDYESANRVAADLGVAGISRQAFGLGKRIFEAERAIAAGASLHEVHPEVSFAAMARRPLAWSKLSYRGAVARAALLSANGIELPPDLGEANGVPTDDVLDAAAAAWSARRIARDEHETIPSPPERFSDGLDAAIHV